MNVKVLNFHDVVITSKWRHKIVKSRLFLQYSKHLVMVYLNAVLGTGSQIKNWNMNVKVLNFHDVIITSKSRHKVLKLRHSLNYSDHLIMGYLNAVFGIGSQIKNCYTNVKVLNYQEVIITSKLRHKVITS